jgi:hypothetical protein
MTYRGQFLQSRGSIEIEHIVTRPASPDQGRTAYLDWKFDIDLLIRIFFRSRRATFVWKRKCISKSKR